MQLCTRQYKRLRVKITTALKSESLRWVHPPEMSGVEDIYDDNNEEVDEKEELSDEHQLPVDEDKSKMDNNTVEAGCLHPRPSIIMISLNRLSQSHPQSYT